MGRRSTRRKRVGERESKTVDALKKQVSRFCLTKKDAKRRETTINKRLVSFLQSKDGRVTSKGTHLVRFAGEKYIPDAVLLGSAAYPLLAVECKRLTTRKAGKRLWKEGLAQTALYSRRYKVTFLVLYDFTKGHRYKKAFGRGNKTESSFARTLREGRIHVVVCAP